RLWVRPHLSSGRTESNLRRDESCRETCHKPPRSSISAACFRLLRAGMTRSDTGSAPCPGGFGLYVHWPFCQSKCPYCDFNSHVPAPTEEGRWRAPLLAELEHFANKTPSRRLDPLFFGGGTPSLMAPATVAAVIDAAARHWTMAGDVEITLGANPGSPGAGPFTRHCAAGTNLLSPGVYTLYDAPLPSLCRLPC